MDQVKKNIERSQGYVRSMSSLNAYMTRGTKHASQEMQEEAPLETKQRIDPAVISKVRLAISSSNAKTF